MLLRDKKEMTLKAAIERPAGRLKAAARLTAGTVDAVSSRVTCSVSAAASIGFVR